MYISVHKFQLLAQGYFDYKSASLLAEAMASWGIADLVKEISDMEVIAMRNKGSELLPRMKTSLMAKMQGVQLISASNYVALMDALEKSSLPDAMKKELETCFEEKTVASLEGPTRLQNRPQSMTMPYNYLSKSEWQKVLDGANTVDACNVVIKRMKLCGLKSLKEDSKKHLTAFLVCLQMRTTQVLPPIAEMYKLSQFVHDTFPACMVQPLCTGLAKYPPSPFDLGQASGWTRLCLLTCSM